MRRLMLIAAFVCALAVSSATLRADGGVETSGGADPQASPTPTAEGQSSSPTPSAFDSFVEWVKSIL